jgi:ferredoxin, 2Fe-2S
MPRITIMPHETSCPEGASFEAKAGTFLCDAMLKNGIEIEHACEKSCACSTCHVIIREGYASLTPAGEDEEDQLDKAWGMNVFSRLACQVIVRHDDLLVEMPRYTINLAQEGH